MTSYTKWLSAACWHLRYRLTLKRMRPFHIIAFATDNFFAIAFP